MEWLSEYNYDYALASIPIQLVLIAFYCSRRNLPIRQSRSFLWVMLINLVMTTSDIVSCEMNEVWTSFPLWLMYAVNMVYFLAFVLRGWALFDYTAEACNSYRVFDRRVNYVLWVPAFVLCGIILSTPWTATIFHFAPVEGYYNCGLYQLIYFNTYFYIAVSLVFVVACWGRTDLRMSLSMLAYNAILIAGIRLRSLFINTLVTSYFSILAILVIYLSAQNPDLFRDKRIGVFNQDAFDEIVLEYLYKRRPFHCVIITIPNYGAARALYGHKQTIRCLELIGEWIEREYSSYYVFTCGGGDFVLLRSGRTDEVTNTCVQGIKTRFARPWKSIDTEVALAVSVICLPYDVIPESITEVDDLIRYAIDHCQYQGKDEYAIISDDMMSKMLRRKAVEHAIGKALAERRFEVYMQPIYGIAERRIVGAEALARLTDDELGPIPPDEFIGVAEQTGDIMELGRQVFDRACAFLEENNVGDLGIRKINVNLSPAQCLNNQLATEFAQIAHSHGVPLSMIDLEVTESAAEDLTSIREQMDGLLAAGTEFALDDFGTGTSNITRLLSLPLHVVKLDMTVVWSYFRGDSTLLPDLITMFRNVNMKVVVEGIETEEMHRAVEEMGCDYEQGYYYSRPLPPQEFVRYMRGLS